MKEIELTLGKKALVDDADFEWLNQYKWSAVKGTYTFYAARSAKDENGKFKRVQMHREITQTPKGLQTDHADGNGLNNQRSNLRVCTIQQNQHNTTSHRDSSSKYKGVSWKKSGKKWLARIKINAERRHIGVYKTEIEAAQAYDKVAKESFGEFARLNLPTNITSDK